MKRTVLLLLLWGITACEKPDAVSGEGHHCTSRYSIDRSNHVCKEAADLVCVSTHEVATRRDGVDMTLPSYICRTPCLKGSKPCSYATDVCCPGANLEEDAFIDVCVPPHQCATR